MGLLVLKKGVHGHEKEVKTLQGLLNDKLIPSPHLPQTGVFADHTETAVKKFQKQKGLKDDGVVGPKTWTALGQPLPHSGNVAAGLPGEIRIEYGPNALHLSSPAEMVLRELLQAAGLSYALVTSTYRSPKDQARVMFNNLRQYGEDEQRTLYNGKPGCKVIDAYAAGVEQKLSDAEIKQRMEKKIVELGPETVSRHCSTEYDVLDVAPSSITKLKRFDKAIRAQKKKRVANYIKPKVLGGSDPAFHIELYKGVVGADGTGKEVQGYC